MECDELSAPSRSAISAGQDVPPAWWPALLPAIAAARWHWSGRWPRSAGWPPQGHGLDFVVGDPESPVGQDPDVPLPISAARLCTSPVSCSTAADDCRHGRGRRQTWCTACRGSSPTATSRAPWTRPLVDGQMDLLRRASFSQLLGSDWAHGVEAAVDIALLGRYYDGSPTRPCRWPTGSSSSSPASTRTPSTPDPRAPPAQRHAVRSLSRPDRMTSLASVMRIGGYGDRTARRPRWGLSWCPPARTRRWCRARRR